ncbi:hypothetical protein [Bradyrhizobium sp. BR13661]|jgi:hypothetical protein|uniref:hypothetical protein n=1 Tax=Bradyrhizobium sp. BR13661 TaxID=2940622 RepID=UPI0024761989|nr:hypothetical protein [Bradyrhizobium sp. BR13661]MDH6259192.1 hypothetical protein [Bradyrhizobium sp. BR13661]
MPTIFELLYREFCRARLAEMRKQLLLTREHPKVFLPDDDSPDPDGTDPQHEAELKRAGE